MNVPVVINEDWCKGCRVCVEFCPTDVLEMHRDKAVAVRQDDCTGCLMCEIHCPDLAIKIYREFAKGRKKKTA